MKRLLLAAGGGGDAITTAMVHTALHGAGEPALVLTYAWERLVVDPVPGPRRPSDFTGTVPAGPTLRLVTPATAPRPPAGSLLPRLAAGLRPELGLLDPYEGATGLARQIEEAAAYCGADRLDIVDVGGDVLADGTEPTLRSPLGDALALAACAHTALPAFVHVAGPGLDSEVPESALLPKLGAPLRTLTTADTLPVERVFDWHPSEASALLVAAARGIRGVCGTRDAPHPVTLTATSPALYRLTAARARELNPLARELIGTTDLAEAERASERVCGFSEIARERARAARTAPPGTRPGEAAGSAPTMTGLTGHPSSPPPLVDRFAQWERRTARAGISYVTSRRIIEELDLDQAAWTELRDHLRTASPSRDAAPLWRLAG
ncbi:DUF1152 domain-containing protein [Streptomyces sp. RS10V-4]|uniref:DUF1152 domain-containing protein n=1 Tax=Streptomyces rhizoryzae TaxID=2932493 RepID=UPI00200413BE|nr:DUF1152 domain-containing protein [Streptomyces rhizoryzae]MCK7626078.1 DUF1152 domain-containing protein [Streptomyces rhizoryzae]